MRLEHTAGFGVDQPFEWPLHGSGERQKLADLCPMRSAPSTLNNDSCLACNNELNNDHADNHLSSNVAARSAESLGMNLAPQSVGLGADPNVHVTDCNSWLPSTAYATEKYGLADVSLRGSPMIWRASAGVAIS